MYDQSLAIVQQLELETVMHYQKAMYINNSNVPTSLVFPQAMEAPEIQTFWQLGMTHRSPSASLQKQDYILSKIMMNLKTCHWKLYSERYL